MTRLRLRKTTDSIACSPERDVVPIKSLMKIQPMKPIKPIKPIKKIKRIKRIEPIKKPQQYLVAEQTQAPEDFATRIEMDRDGLQTGWNCAVRAPDDRWEIRGS
jgi:hypothetical protein